MGISVVDFRCREPHTHEGPEEPNPAYSIVFLRKGLFARRRGKEKVIADPNQVLFFNAGELGRFSHPVPGGDDCTILAVDRAHALELVAEHAPRDAEKEALPFPKGHGLLSTRAARLHYELLGLIADGAPRLAIEDAISDLANESVRAVYSSDEDPKRGPRAAARNRELANAAQVALAANVERFPSLDDLARSLGCSPFHLSRTFRGVKGMTLRAYGQRLRARLAAERLRAVGAEERRDLTSVALDLGYSDHSHFTNAFRREWGVPPSRFRARTSKRSRPAGR